MLLYYIVEPVLTPAPQASMIRGRSSHDVETKSRRPHVKICEHSVLVSERHRDRRTYWLRTGSAVAVFVLCIAIPSLHAVSLSLDDRAGCRRPNPFLARTNVNPHQHQLRSFTHLMQLPCTTPLHFSADTEGVRARRVTGEKVKNDLQSLDILFQHFKVCISFLA